MFLGNSVVKPVGCESKNLPGIVAVMTATVLDFKLVDRLSRARFVMKRKLYNSWVSTRETCDGLRYSIVGPFIGAPYAGMLFETLLAWGVNRLIVVGWCGSVSKDLNIGDIVVPDRAIIDEGTSNHYSAGIGSLARASLGLNLKISDIFKKNGLDFHNGLVWTTDAVFRETVAKVRYFKNIGALAVEMEVSAIFSIAQFRGVEAAGVLIVSDALRGSQWFPGFKTKSFERARNSVCQIINDLCCELA